MADNYTEVTNTSWFSRLGNSFGGIGAGLVMIALATFLLYWNEGRAVRTGDAIAEAQMQTVALPGISTLDSSYDGKLVYATGRVVTEDTLTDSMFGITTKAIRLRRKVEYYQWVEDAKQELEDARTEQEEKKAELEEEKAALEQKIADAAALIADLQSDIEAYKKAYDEFEAAEKAVQAQIDQQVAELKRQEEQQQQQDPSYDPGAANGATGSMMWPCPSCHYVTSPFGWRYHPIYHENRYHSGVDIGASYGATIVAADGGTVITAGSVSGYGNCVVINHGNGLTTLYGHMSSIAVSVGQRVSKGQTIGYVGSTGNSNGPHLHWEVAVNGQRVNPLNYAT